MTVFSPMRGAAMDGGRIRWKVLLLTNLEMRRLALILHVLRLEADGGVGEKFVCRCADLCSGP